MSGETAATIECIECREALAALPSLSRSELCGVIESLVAACHAARPHCSHALRLAIDNTQGVERELTIRCKAKNCARAPALVTTCPVELVGALTLVFHTAHEGHPIELTYDGRTWSSPG